MSATARTTKTQQAIRAVRLVGFCIYVAAFFLPAVRQMATPGNGVPDIYKGWLCAWVTVMNSFSREVWHSKEALAILSGWINPLVGFYLLLLIGRKLVGPPSVATCAVHRRRCRSQIPSEGEGTRQLGF